LSTVNRVTLRIAGLDFRLIAQPDTPSIDLPPRYHPFILKNSPDRPAAEFIVSKHLPKSAQIPPEELVWTCETWRMGRMAGGKLCIQINTVPGNQWVTTGLLEPDFSAGQIIPRHGGRNGSLSDTPLNYPWDQVIIINRLVRNQAGVVHASGIRIGKRALIFCAASDTGKTTIARLWKEAGGIMLNDDRMVLRRVGDRVLAEASPWHGEVPDLQTGMVPLAGILHLRQASENRLTGLKPAEATVRLLGVSIAPHYSREAMECLLETWTAITDKVPSYELAFTPDHRAVELCRTNILKNL
jgi:hypothetical protein